MKNLHYTLITLLFLFFALPLINAQTQVGGDIDGEAAFDRSGWSVSMSSDGNRVAIGAPNNDGNGLNAGHVRIYEESGGSWAQIGNDIDGEGGFHVSGRSVSMNSDGSRVAIGAPYEGINGYVRIYEENGGVWTQIGNNIFGGVSGDEAGYSVSMSSDGSRVAIGAPGSSGNGTLSGHVQIYEESGGVWTQIGSDIDGEAPGDRSGWSVSMSSDGSRVAIGARFNVGNGNGPFDLDFGHVRIYEENGGVWTQIGNDIDGEGSGDQAGYSVSMSSDGSRVAIGAPFNGGNGNASGHVRIYEETGGVWTQIGNDIDGEGASYWSGWSVSMSSDGNRVAIGAPNPGGNDSGQVRIYEETGGVWSQFGADIDGEALLDESGHSVSLNSEGSRVAIGAPLNDGNGLTSGHVRIYEILDPCGSTSLSVSATSTNSDCLADNGTATATPSGGTGTITYLWTNNETTQTINGLAPGEYTVTATDENGCTAEATTTVALAPNTLTANATSTDSDCTAGNGTANATTAGGTGTITYLWTNNETTQTITNLAPGEYTVTATDENGCTAESTTTVTLAPNTLTVNATSTNSDCTADNGTANATASGGTGIITYLWTNNETTQTITNLAPGEYTVTATDENGCTAEAATTVGQSTGNLVVNITTTDAICTANNGTATAVPSGGPGPYTYIWTFYQTTATITNLAPGSYQVIVGDANGCTAGATAEVGQSNDIPVVDLEIIDPELCVESDAIELNGGSPTGGVYSGTGVTANTDGTVFTFDPTSVAPEGGEVTITYTFTDENGCIGTATDLLFVDPICCAFAIDCSNLIDENLGCLSELPAPDNALITIDDSCFSPVITSVDSDNNGGGCMGDPLIITRTYTVIDDDGDENTVDEIATCTATYTIVDNLEPIVICPPSLTLECGESTDPSNTGMAEVFDNCTVDLEFSDAITADGSLIFRNWKAIDACGNVVSCTQFINVDICDFEATDPCVCVNNASTINLDANTGGDDGQFSELVTITGAGGAPIADPNLVFEVIASTGAVDAFAPSPIPPSQTAGMPIPVGTQLVYNTTTMHYEIPFYHYDGTGYSMTVQQIINGTPGQILGPIGNVCAYPNPVFDPVIQDEYCPEDMAITLGGTDQNNAGFDNISFTIDGVTVTELDPTALALGTHTVLMTFDGADDLNNGTGPIANPNQPGCIQTVQDMFDVNDIEAPVITFCPAAITVECDQSTDPTDTGIITATDNCNAAPTITFDDLSTQGMGCLAHSYTIIRTFTATDGAGNTAQCTQTITVEDNNPPTITVPANVTVECDQPTDPGATGYATASMDNCAADDQLTVVFSDISTQIPTGCGNDTYLITRTWIASDPCGNTAQGVQLINVADTTPPTIVCPAAVTIECDEDTSPANTGMAVAIDDCAAADEILITFADASTQTMNGCGQYQYVITRTWTATDPCGNATNCIQVITVEDTTEPMIVCPTAISLSCTAATDPADTGIATGTDNCTVVDEVIVTFTDISTQTNEGCGKFTYEIFRTWLATDACGNTTTCLQNLTIVDTEAPVITCLPNQTLTCFETVPSPITNSADYITAGGTISDDCTTALADFTVFAMNEDSGGNNCPGNGRTIVRTYFIADACGNTSTCTQTFTYLESAQAPIITSILPSCYKYCASLVNPMESDITFTTDCSFDATVSMTGPTQIGAANCPGTIYRYTYTVTDDCGRNSTPVTRDFIIGNNGPTVECAPFNLILECGDPNNQEYIDTHLDQITVNTSCASEFTVNTSPQNFNLISCGSATVVTFVATDACGRTASCTSTISIIDTEAPTFTAVPPSLSDEINCSADINYWYNHWIDDMVDALEAEDACDSNVSIQALNTPVNTDCPNGDAITVVTFVATDNCGNEAELTGTFTVTATPSNLNVMGMAVTESGEAVENVVVTLEGPNNYLTSVETEADGLYGFENLLLGNNYQISPLLNENPLNGVSSYDLVLISKHILQLQSLDSPYKMIAADVNKSGSITTMDIIELRKLILHIDEAFSNNTSWRFVEASYMFPEPSNPFASIFPEETFINGLTAEEQHDFVGVKIGDLNGSAVANALAGAESRNAVDDLVFTVKDQQLKAGETYELSFQAADFEDIHGYQFSLSYNPLVLDFVDLSTGSLDNLSESNFGFSKLDNGVITTSWTNQEAQSLTRGASVFKLKFVARADARLSDAIAVNSRYTVAEAYNEHMDLMNVTLRFEERIVSETAFHLYQNHPNPFGAEQTLIGFKLPEAGRATLNVYDAAGRLLKRMEGDFEEGYGNFLLSNDGLESGLLYYELVSGNNRATGRMIYEE